jgi:hypothetical protein
MKLSAKEAVQLMPKGYITSEAICVRIKSIAEAGLNYFKTDLTLGQVDEFKNLGYEVEYDQYSRTYKITWK